MNQEKRLTGFDVLNAIAFGAKPEKFEWVYFVNGSMSTTTVDKCWTLEKITSLIGGGYYREKLITRVVNGFTVPAPEKVMPARGAQYYVPDFCEDDWQSGLHWDGSNMEIMWLERGLIFLSKEAAIANAKAMCGVNPK